MVARKSNSDEDLHSVSADEQQSGPKFKSVRRAFRIMDLISERGEDITAKELARAVGTNLSSCYYLLNILVEEGYIEKVPRSGGYKLGPTIATLNEMRPRSNLDSTVEPIVEGLARRAERHAYFGVLSEGELLVTQVESPPKSPPAGVVEGFHGASHALALGKVLLAGMGSEYVEDYIRAHGLEAFTPRTIVQPTQLHAHLNKVRMVGVATELEEFAQNLCSVAAPVERASGEVEGAIALSTITRRARSELQQLADLVREASKEASALLNKKR